LPIVNTSFLGDLTKLAMQTLTDFTEIWHFVCS